MKVGHITRNNASNNPTMTKEFAARLKTTTGKKYNWRKRKINCLVHVINLATQMLISTYSKSLHFNAKQPDAHVPTSCNEVGLVRAIVVKVHISTLPEKNIITHPWSGMLIIKCIDAFVNELHWEEQDSVKHDKIRELKLTSEEWLRVNTFLGLLSVCLLFHLQIKA
ncbi:hypothetical protein L208DRAFT_1281721 [Tricholoma matsutake]|nr:hypothetical protein L208DRAFT_1281721 [Tricholoma matsutake 945]